MPCCGGQPLAYLRREVPDGRDVGARAESPHRVADVAGREGCSQSTGCPTPLIPALLLVGSEVPVRCALIRLRGGGAAGLVAMVATRYPLPPGNGTLAGISRPQRRGRPAGVAQLGRASAL